MLALYRSGRQAEALATFRTCRQLLAGEFGLEPGPDLRELHQLILRADPVIAGAARPDLRVARQAPAQLPHDVRGFTGRSQELAWLDSLLPPPYTSDAPATTPLATSAPVTPPPRDAPPGAGRYPRPDSPTAGEATYGPAEPYSGHALTLCTIEGMGGVGKSVLAVHWAHRVAHHFPDGQIHLNLAGHSPSRAPVTSQEALQQILGALGLPPESLPTDLDELIGRYRSVLAHRRLLLLLDDAASYAQVAPLLPGSSDCLVIVTSRHQLPQLAVQHGAHRRALGLFSAHESCTLLARLLGRHRTDAEPWATAELARLCGHLPLALSIVAANAVAQQHHRTLADIAQELSQGNRLNHLSTYGHDPVTVRAAFELSSRQLDAQTRHVLGRLGPSQVEAITPELVASSAGLGLAQAERSLRSLTTAHLLEEMGVDRYRFHHELLKLFAAELADAPAP
jgi:hypothetical protein